MSTSGQSPRPIALCLVGPSPAILGGQALQLRQLLERLQEVPGVSVEFVPVNPALGGFLGRLQEIKYVRTVVTSIAYLSRLIPACRRADVVHAFSASYWSFLLAPLPAILVARALGRPVVLNYRSGEADDHLRRWRPTVVPFARMASRIVVPSDYLVGVFRDHDLAAVAIPNIVDTSRFRFRQRSQPRPRFFSNRNLEPMYNVACVLRAFSIIQQRHGDAELVVAGDGSQRAHLERLARELGLRNVRFVGRVTPAQMPDAYDAADIYLNSPDIDNMPNSILEAYASGLPVVTTDAGGIPFIARHEENALVVRRGDFAAMAGQALRLLEEPGLALRLAQQAHRECVERYTWERVCDRWTRLYADCVGFADGSPPTEAAAGVRLDPRGHYGQRAC
ncbi:MAG TPA: glycosyltransferase family 4 protein [Gemmatimonadaceae bacterium]